MFGPHLTLDMYGCSKKKLRDVGYISSFLDQLPTQIGMTKIFPPYVFQYSGLKPEDWGVSGIILIAESHISIHTFVEKEYASFDIFSCKDFDTAAAEKLVLEKFEARAVERNLFVRGRHFPKNQMRVAQILENSREVARIKEQ